MKKKHFVLSQVIFWLKLVTTVSLLAVSCTTEIEEIEPSNFLTNNELNLSSKSVEIPIVGITSDTEQHKDSYIELAIDDDKKSKWLAYGDEIYVDLDLEYIQLVDYVKVSFYNGDDKAHEFEVYALVDGVFEKIGSKTSSGTNTKLVTYDLSNAETNILRFKFEGNDIDLANGVNDIEVWGTLLNLPVNKQHALITDTSNTDTGELRLDLSETIAVGKMSVTVSKDYTQDGFINLSGTSTSRGNALIDMRIDDTNGYEFTESGTTANTIANFPAFSNNQRVAIEISWDATAATATVGPLVSVSIDGQMVTDTAFVSESGDLVSVLGGVKTIQFRLGGNSSFDESGAGMLIDDLKVYDLSSGTPIIVFEDDFESYTLGSSLDPDEFTADATSPYKNNSFQVTVQEEGNIVEIPIDIPVDGYGPASVEVGTVNWQNWYLSVPIDRADGSGNATSIYYQDIETLNLTEEEKTYFNQNADGSYFMGAKFTGYTTSGLSLIHI